MCYEVLAKACCRCVNISLCWSSGKDSRTATSLSGSGDLQWGNGRGGEEGQQLSSPAESEVVDISKDSHEQLAVKAVHKSAMAWYHIGKIL